MMQHIPSCAGAVLKTLPVVVNPDTLPETGERCCQDNRVERGMKWLWLSSLVVVFDQVTKYFAEQHLGYYTAVKVFPGFSMTLVYNKGAAFNILSDAGGWQRWFLMLVSMAISLFLLAWLRTIEKNRIHLAIGIALVLGGAVGNLIDRSLYGHVIDFIDIYYRNWHLPHFNNADSAISLGAALLIYDMFKYSDTK
jgi:signal peptidase II